MKNILLFEQDDLLAKLNNDRIDGIEFLMIPGLSLFI